MREPRVKYIRVMGLSLFILLFIVEVSLLAAGERHEIVFQQGLNDYQGYKKIEAKEMPLIHHFELKGIPPKSHIYKAEFSLYVLDIPAECKSFEMPVYQWAIRRTRIDFRPWYPPIYGIHFASAHPSSFRGGMKIPGVSEGIIRKEKEWVSWDITEMVQCWVDNPEENCGLIIADNDNRKDRFRHRIDLYTDQYTKFEHLEEFYGTKWNPYGSGTNTNDINILTNESCCCTLAA